MNTRERRPDDNRDDNPGEPGMTPPADFIQRVGSLANARREGQGLASAGDDAIRKSLSLNSETWLGANRQEGGQ